MDNNDPQVIREEIEVTRARMEDTVEALVYKTDVKARAKDAIAQRTERAKGVFSKMIDQTRTAVSGAVSTVRDSVSTASERLPSAEDARAGMSSLGDLAVRNPLGLAIGALAIGVLIGLLVPVTDVEREQVGPLGERVVERAREAASDAIEQGKAAVTDAVTSAFSTPQSS